MDSTYSPIVVPAAPVKFVGRLTNARMIIARVASEHGVPVDVILSDARSSSIVAARRAAVRRVAEAEPSLSSSQLGRLFNRDHATISYLLGRTERAKSIEPRVSTDPAISKGVRLRLGALTSAFLSGQRPRLVVATLSGAYPAAVPAEHLERVITGGERMPRGSLSDVLGRVREVLERHGWTVSHDRLTGCRLVEMLADGGGR